MSISKKGIAKRTLVILLALIMTFAMLIPQGFALTGSSDAKDGKWTGACTGDLVISDTISKIVSGVTEHKVTFNNAKGNDQKIDFNCIVEPSTFLGDDKSIKFVAGYGDNSAAKWKMTTVTHQAEEYEKDHPGETVVAAVNADFFNMATGEPLGALIMEDENGKPTKYHNANGRWFFAQKKDGTPVISADESILDDCTMAVGGYCPIVLDGVIQEDQLGTCDADYGYIRYSRSTIGIMEDGSVCTSVTRGRLAPISMGRTFREIAEMYKAQGAKDVLVLDGGGSATYAAKLEGADKLEVRNSPSDGAPREVSSSILVVSTKAPTGVFDHASLEPNDELYTPGSEVQFSAKAIDTAGAAMEFPAGEVGWKLADECKELGTIDSNGKFVAGDKEGEVTVQLTLNGSVVGETAIEIATPDEIYFNTEEISLGFEEETDFGLIVRKNDREINIKDGDIQWSNTVKSEEGYVEDTDGVLGVFNGNIFKANEELTTDGIVTATSVYDSSVKGSLKVIVGMLPTITWDFEDYTNPETGEVIPASKYWTEGYTNANGEAVAPILSTSNYGRGGKESLEIADLDEDEPVRFGYHSLQMNFDFTDCGAVTEGACVGTTDSLTIPGMPTAIGVWVYAPEGVGVDWPNAKDKEGNPISGLWLRAYLSNDSTSKLEVDYTLEPKVITGDQKPGIYWEGWHYCEADLTKFQGPFNIQPGMSFRLMFVNGTNMVGTQRSGELYFDNFQFVYGTNVDDTDSPIVDSFTANNEELTDGAVLNASNVSFEARFSDVENKYTTGIDSKTIRVYVDGINVADNKKFKYETGESKLVVDPDGSRVNLYDVPLKDGEHTVAVTVRDGFGNETTETREFTVDTSTVDENAKVNVEAEEDAAEIGQTVTIDMKADGAGITANTTKIKLGNKFKKYKVEFADNAEGSYRYSTTEGVVIVNAAVKEGTEAFEDGEVFAKLIVDVPSTLTASDEFTYAVKGGTFDRADNTTDTYIQKTKSLPVVATYEISANQILKGDTGSEIVVKNRAGEPAAKAGIYLENGELLGSTDENGVLKTDYFGQEVGSWNIYAKDEAGKLSFLKKITTYEAVGENIPFNIMFNASKNSDTAKNISWFSNVKNGKQYIKYRTAGTEEWTEVEANQDVREFTAGGNKTIYVNNVKVTGLAAGTTYEYILGSDTGWTEAATFETSGNTEKTSFYVLGDIQAEDTTNIDTIMNKLKAGSYDFGIQTGDAVDDAVKYDCWNDIAGLFGTEKMGSTDMIHVLGNHEYAGEANAETSLAAFGLPESKQGGHYSLTYGNVYIAVINYTGTTGQLTEALDWLVKDAQASDAEWKILTMHQPAYYTNIAGGNAEINKYVPEAAEKAGIDCVFSGHDHALARTNPLKGGEIDEDEGIVYYICGSSGEKSYNVASQNIFDYDKVFSIVRGQGVAQSYEATYLTAEADENEMTVKIYDVISDDPIDTYTFQTPCVKNGHKEIYDPETNAVKCSVCGKALSGHNGLIEDKDGNEYYILDGNLQKGWTQISDEIFFFDNNGVSKPVTIKKDIATTCTVRGSCTYSCKAASSDYTVNHSKAPGHEYETNSKGERICSTCGWKEIPLSACNIKLAYKNGEYTGEAKKPIVYVTYTDKSGKKTTFTKTSDYIIYYSNNVKVGTAKVSVRPRTQNYYVNLTEDRGTFAPGDPIILTYNIVPKLTGVKFASSTTTTATIKWDKCPQATGYKVYKWDSSKDKYVLLKKITSNSTTKYVKKNLKAGTHYKFKVVAYTVKNGKTYTGFNKIASGNTKPYKVTGLKLYSRDNGFKATWSKKKGSGYQVRYSTSKSFSSYKTAKVTSSSRLYKTVSGLKNKRTYYVKVRAYKSYSGTKTVYGSWSTVKTIKTK